MNVVIIEDEQHAVKHLQKMLPQYCYVQMVLDGVAESVEWFGVNPMPDLLFMDIQLSDGLSFDIAKSVDITCPIIFTTAFNDYALRAFKLYSIDYLLKPIDQSELEAAFVKYHNRFKPTVPESSVPTPAAIPWEEVLRLAKPKTYHTRLLVRQGANFSPLPIEQIAYISSENGLTFLWVYQESPSKRHLVDYTLDELQEMLPPDQFYRISRKVIVHIQSIRQVSTYFNHRLVLETHPAASESFIVARDRVKDFKEWLGA